MGLDQFGVMVETHRDRVGTGAQRVAHPARRQRVEGLGHLSVLIARHLGIGPARDIVGRGGDRQERRSFFALEVLARQALGAGVAAHPVLVLTPMPRMAVGVLEIEQGLAGEAVVARGGDGPFDPSLVLGPARAGGIDVEAARLGIFEELGREAGAERIGLDDDPLGVVGDQDLEDPAVKRPGGFTGLDGAGHDLAEAGVDEAVARQDGREDPGAEPAAPARCSSTAKRWSVG